MYEYTVNVDCGKNNSKVSNIIRKAFDLYRIYPINSIVPVSDKGNKFHLIKNPTNEQEKEWIELFINSIIDYSKDIDIDICGKLDDTAIIFTDNSKCKKNISKKSKS